MNEWISVEDRLPVYETNHYLVTDGQEVDIYCWKLWRKTGRKQEWTFEDRDGFLDIEVTHWMPLPEPPND